MSKDIPGAIAIQGSRPTVESLATIFNLPVVSACVWHKDVPGLKTVSEANVREHWAKKAKRAKAQKAWIRIACRFPKQLPRMIRIVRIGRRNLDSDNLAGAFKAVRDQIAQSIGVDDGDPCTAWTYGQEKGETGIRIEFWR